jgi:hypothetical protein
MFSKIAVTLLIFVACSTALSAEERVVARISFGTPKSLQEFLSRTYDIASVNPGVSADIVISLSEYRALLSQGYNIRTTQTETTAKRNLRLTGHHLGKVDAYRTYETMLAELQALEADHPDICKLYDIGNSMGKEYCSQGKTNYSQFNHDIWALKISANVGQAEDKPAVLFCGEHHAREPIGLEVTMAVLNYIVSHYGKDSVVTKNVDTKEIWFVPLVNPDGHKVVITQQDVWWRKNIRDNDSTNQFENGSDGVDLNRNYVYAWGGAGSSPDPAVETYCGPAPFSETETCAMKSLIDTCKFIAGITFHSYGEAVQYPYAYGISARAPDYGAMADLASHMAATIPSLSGSGSYVPQKWSSLYEAGGIIDDYAYVLYGTFLFTIEIGNEFIPPADSIKRICADNISSAMLLLDRSNHATLTGHAYTLYGTARSPLVGEVYVQEIDDTITTQTAFRSPFKTNQRFGAYRRMMLPGAYAVTFKPDSACYAPQTFTNVNVVNNDTTLLDFVYPLSGIPNNAGVSQNPSGIFTIKIAQDAIILYVRSDNSERVLDFYSFGGKRIDRIRMPATSAASCVTWNTRPVPAGIYLAKLMGHNGKTLVCCKVTVNK